MKALYWNQIVQKLTYMISIKICTNLIKLKNKSLQIMEMLSIEGSIFVSLS